MLDIKFRLQNFNPRRTCFQEKKIDDSFTLNMRVCYITSIDWYELYVEKIKVYTRLFCIVPLYQTSSC